MTDAGDPYTRRPEDVREPPTGLRATLRHLGPGLILVGSVVGSGEIILTTTLGATVGFAMLWWILFSCWSKSIVQAELGRYSISSGETALQAFNRVPGRLTVGGRQISWVVLLWLFAVVPGHLIGGGIYGGVGQAVHMALPFVASKWWTLVFAFVAVVLVLNGSYRVLERLLTVMVIIFTLITMACAVLLQFTEYAITWADLGGSLRLDFPAFAIGAAVAAYGATGVTAAEATVYTYWCTEKGYGRFAGPRSQDSAWARRARGWIRVMQTDVALTLVVLTLATVPFYVLGASVLHRLGHIPNGLQTLEVLSNMYTETLGQWAYWLFMFGALFVLFSTVVSGLGGGARVFADAAAVLGLIDIGDYKARLRLTRIYTVVSPILMALTYFLIENPVWMLTVGGVCFAALSPVVAGSTVYLRYRHTDARLAPGWKSDVMLWICFLAMLGLGSYVVSLLFYGGV